MHRLYTEATLEVFKRIGLFYLEENDKDYGKARDAIRNLGIIDVIVTLDVVVFKLTRPGIFIGKRGEKIDKLSAFLGRKIHVIEGESVVDLLYPFPEGDKDYDEWERENYRFLEEENDPTKP